MSYNTSDYINMTFCGDKIRDLWEEITLRSCFTSNSFIVLQLQGGVAKLQVIQDIRHQVDKYGDRKTFK